MAVTYGFYDSINHDRMYSAKQFGSIFDGIIKDGVFMSIGDHFRVSPSSGMTLAVGSGRAWFNHTWILNDAPIPVVISQSELLLDRIDAIVIDVNSDTNVRANSIIVVKGTPSHTPARPALINTGNHHQYPLAYVTVKANVTELGEADIAKVVGFSSTPYVTGILETADIDDLFLQWSDQWNNWYESQIRIMQNDYNAWHSDMSSWTSNYKTEFDSWADNYKDQMNATAEEWQSMWEEWFYSYTNQNQQEFSNWKREKETEFNTWFNSLQAILDGDVATNLTNRVVALESCCEDVKDFMNNLEENHAIYDDLYDNNAGHPIEPILDSSGHSILNSVIFVIK